MEWRKFSSSAARHLLCCSRQPAAPTVAAGMNTIIMINTPSPPSVNSNFFQPLSSSQPLFQVLKAHKDLTVQYSQHSKGKQS